MPEFLDLVDEEDKVIGQAERPIIHETGLLHREVHIFLVSQDRKIVFQKRISRLADNLIDAAAGGHVDAGEDYSMAALREAHEEIGITISPDNLVLIDKVRTTEDIRKISIVTSKTTSKNSRDGYLCKLCQTPTN